MTVCPPHPRQHLSSRQQFSFLSLSRFSLSAPTTSPLWAVAWYLLLMNGRLYSHLLWTHTALPSPRLPAFSFSAACSYPCMPPTCLPACRTSLSSRLQPLPPSTFSSSRRGQGTGGGGTYKIKHYLPLLRRYLKHTFASSRHHYRRAGGRYIITSDNISKTTT